MIGISDDISSEIDPSALTEDFGYALLRRQSVTIDKYVYTAPNGEDAANTEDGERKENEAETGESEFTDVSVSDFFYDAVMRAKKNGITGGITKGMGGNTFLPNADCTGGEIVTFLYRQQQ